MLNALYKSVVSTVGNVTGLGGLPSSMKFHITKKVVDGGGRSRFWEVYEGTSKADGSEVTALVLLKKTATYTEILMARNAMNRMRTLRHPCVLKVYDAVENDTGIYVVVERCSRLADFSWRQEDRKQPCVWGLYSIISALRFLVVDGKLVHGNVGPQSVFVTPKGEFRLGGFELARPISEADGNRLVSDIDSSGLTRFVPPRKLMSGNPSVVDLYGLALVAAYLLNGEVLYRGEGSFNPGEDPAASIPSKYRGGFRSLSLHEISRSRDVGMMVTRLANSSFLKENPQVTILHFLESQLRLATAVAQDEFFDSVLPNVLSSLPVTMQVTVLLHDLVQVVDDAPRLAAPALVNLTKIGTYLSPEEFKRDLLPTVLKLFGSSDRKLDVGWAVEFRA
ncbi:tyrosine kinase [Perkinsus olseni]|uniref:Tyrosine kinase n=1 Tax=Perkinsus olseni TaxID=32597 RepID=A0A7J6UMY7_PEROL|nr:tyrosine kinase [Perkinsus olseni]KAF4758634.1 tyrosine kinase [Perkinsus olseni]